jgi:hypothetical protein
MNEYKMIQGIRTKLEQEINELAVTGWEAISISPLGNVAGATLVALLVRKKAH